MNLIKKDVYDSTRLILAPPPYTEDSGPSINLTHFNDHYLVIPLHPGHGTWWIPVRLSFLHCIFNRHIGDFPSTKQYNS